MKGGRLNVVDGLATPLSSRAAVDSMLSIGTVTALTFE